MKSGLLRVGKVDDLFTLIRAAARTGAVGELGGLALGAYGHGRSGQEVVGTPHVFAGLGCLLLRYCHRDSPLVRQCHRDTILCYRDTLKSFSAPNLRLTGSFEQEQSVLFRSAPQ